MGTFSFFSHVLGCIWVASETKVKLTWLMAGKLRDENYLKVQCIHAFVWRFCCWLSSCGQFPPAVEMRCLEETGLYTHFRKQKPQILNNMPHPEQDSGWGLGVVAVSSPIWSTWNWLATNARDSTAGQTSKLPLAWQMPLPTCIYWIKSKF